MGLIVSVPDHCLTFYFVICIVINLAVSNKIKDIVDENVKYKRPKN